MVVQTSKTSNLLVIPFLLVFLNYSFYCYSQPQIINYTKEKIYLHIDKSDFYTGENIWFKAYLIDSKTHSSETLSKVVYVELIAPNGSILSRKRIKITNGGGHGDFKLGSKLESGAYTIRAYTNYIRNFDQTYFFRKTISINTLKSEVNRLVTEVTSKPDLQFFPEGGYLVNDFFNRVGFKTLDSNGNGVNIKGVIVDNLGNKISKFESSHVGIGVFHFEPKRNETYKAIFVYHGKEFIYDLPKSLATGVLIKTVEHKDHYGIYLQSSMTNGLNNFILLGSQRNGVLFNSIIKSTKDQVVVKVPKNILKEGIVQFTLLDNNKKPILERLAFYESGNSQLDVTISSSKEQYQTRDLVELELSLDSIVSKKARTNMSIAVTDMSTVKYNKYDLDIKSQLLLNSELKGDIEQPGYYFYSSNPKRKEHLDMLMMTHGWRQFIINDTLNKNTFIAEVGISLSGSIKKFYNHNKSVAAEVSLTYNNLKEMAYKSLVTDTEGRFRFTNLDFIDSTSIILQAKKPNLEEGKKIKGADMSFHIELDSFIAPQVTLRPNLKLSQKEALETASRSQAYLESLAEFQEGTEQLNEVILQSDYLTKKNGYRKKRVLLYKEPSQTIDFEEIEFFPNNDIFTSLIGRVPGIRITSEGVIIRGNSSLTKSTTALILVDGTPIEGSLGSIASIPAQDVHFVDILKGPRASIFGSKGAGGVIAIYTKNGSEKSNYSKNYKTKGLINFIHPGYSQARKFYEPKYNITNETSKKVDYRSTVYWNPTVKFNEDGKVRIYFYSADFETTYKVDLEGITSDGDIIKTESQLIIK